LTGASVLDYAGDLSWQGSGWEGLVDRLQEMQGGSSDIYYALVRDGPVEDGLSRGRASASTQHAYPAAHELGHALGRSPPPSPRVPPPLNVDPNYPFSLAGLGE